MSTSTFKPSFLKGLTALGFIFISPRGLQQTFDSLAIARGRHLFHTVLILSEQCP